MFKVLYLSNIPSPYMVNYLNELGLLCNLTVVFEKSSSSERNNRWNKYNFINFTGHVLKGFSIGPDSALSLGIFKHIIKKSYDFVFITNFTTPTGIIAIIFFKLFKRKYILESEGGFAKNKKNIKEVFKRFLIKGAHYYFSANSVGDNYFISYGATKDKIVRYPFTSIYNKDIDKKYHFQKEFLKLNYGIKGKKNAICVGRFIKLKNYEWLINNWSKVDPNYYLYIVGEGPLKVTYLNLIEKLNLKNIEILDYVEKDKLFDLYKASDLLIHPTLSDVWGLVLNEAMANGLPVITTPMCLAGYELVKDGINGFVNYPDEDFIKNTQKILSNDYLIKDFGDNSIKLINNFTFENMATIHIKLLSDLYD
jgi:glycosyltransferase involved in cell wall biosynthesis